MRGGRREQTLELLAELPDAIARAREDGRPVTFPLARLPRAAAGVAARRLLEALGVALVGAPGRGRPSTIRPSPLAQPSPATVRAYVSRALSTSLAPPDDPRRLAAEAWLAARTAEPTSPSAPA